MKKTLVILSLISALGLTSCKKTLKGVAEDAKNAVESTGEAASDAVKAVGNAASEVAEETKNAVQGAGDRIKEVVMGVPVTGNKKIDAFLKEAKDYFKEAKEAYQSKDKNRLAEIKQKGKVFAKKQEEIRVELQKLPAETQSKISDYFTARNNEIKEILTAE